MAQDPSSPASEQRLAAPTAQALARVPGLESGQAPRRVVPLEGGTVNQLWMVESTSGRFVLRIDGPEARRPGVERAREFVLHAHAAVAGIAPELIYTDAAAGIMVSTFVEGRRWLEGDCLDRAALRRLAERLASLHALAAPVVTPFDPALICRDYIEKSRRHPGWDEGRGLQLLRAVEGATVRLANEGDRRCIIHGDLNHLNIIESGRLWLVDWEYAQVADPVLDLGCLLAYYPAAAAHSADLLTAAGLTGAGIQERLARATFLYQAMSWFWHFARGEVPPGAWPGLN